MSKRKIVVDGEVKMVSFHEWKQHDMAKSSTKKTKKIRVENDQVNTDVRVDSPFNNGDPINIDQKPTKTEE